MVTRTKLRTNWNENKNGTLLRNFTASGKLNCHPEPIGLLDKITTSLVNNFLTHLPEDIKSIWVFLPSRKIGNNGKNHIRWFTTRKKKNQATKYYLQWTLNLGPLSFRSNTPFDLAWHMQVRGSLSCLLFLINLILGHRWSS